MVLEDRWLAAQWPKIRPYLPAPPAHVIEVGCGTLGGFVPALQSCGYQALGIDPAAPDGDSYWRIEVERAELHGQANAVVACTSLHHLADPGEVLDKIAQLLAPGGLVIVVEWDWERFDEATAEWCFERLGESESWLHHRRDEWITSAQPLAAIPRNLGKRAPHPHRRRCPRGTRSASSSPAMSARTVFLRRPRQHD